MAKILLASQSPRRRQLLEQAGFVFEVISKNTDESFPPDMAADQIPAYLAQKKADAFADEVAQGYTVITADTVVILHGKVINKPDNLEEAVEMLKQLSGQKHEVVTGVCLTNKDKQLIFSDLTNVFFKNLSVEEINFYVQTYKPLDKAGAYGVQEWIGLIGVERIEGSYFNVMGLPVHKVYQVLKSFE